MSALRYKKISNIERPWEDIKDFFEEKITDESKLLRLEQFFSKNENFALGENCVFDLLKNMRKESKEFFVNDHTNKSVFESQFFRSVLSHNHPGEWPNEVVQFRDHFRFQFVRSFTNVDEGFSELSEDCFSPLNDQTELQIINPSKT